MDKHTKVLLEFINYATLPSQDPTKSFETKQIPLQVKQISQTIPSISYSMFLEIASQLDQNGTSFESYISRQISTLYFLLRLAPLVVGDRQNSIEEPENILFPTGVIDIPSKSACQLIINFLMESWNRYTEYGPPQTDREILCTQRLYHLIAEVVRIYGWWCWPFFNHFESSDHVDSMTKIIEDCNGHLPISPWKT